MNVYENEVLRNPGLVGKVLGIDLMVSIKITVDSLVGICW
jgi:hypothetical protein